MAEELTGWDKVGAGVRKRNAMRAHAGRQPVSAKVLDFLRGVTAPPGVAKPKDWIALRPTKKELLEDI